MPADARAWWSARRRVYNVVLVVAGLLAFLAYALEVEFLSRGDPQAEVTVFTTAAQAMGYLVFLGVANLAFGLGAFVEGIVTERNASMVGAYRRTAFAMGMALSVAVPLAVPVMVAVLGRR